MRKNNSQRIMEKRKRRARRLLKTIPKKGFSRLMGGLPLPRRYQWRDFAELFRTRQLHDIIQLIKRAAITPKLTAPPYKRGKRNWMLSRKELRAMNMQREADFKAKLAASIAAVPDKGLAGAEPKPVSEESNS